MSLSSPVFCVKFIRHNLFIFARTNLLYFYKNEKNVFISRLDSGTSQITNIDVKSVNFGASYSHTLLLSGNNYIGCLTYCEKSNTLVNSVYSLNTNAYYVHSFIDNKSAYLYAIDSNGILTDINPVNALTNGLIINLSSNLILTASNLNIEDHDYQYIAFGTAFGIIKVCKLYPKSKEISISTEIGKAKGALFSVQLINFHAEIRVIAASEDRAVNVFQMDLNSVWQHIFTLNTTFLTARIWCVRADQDFGIAVVGEDCKLAYWPSWDDISENKIPKILDTLHRGRNIWSLDFAKNKDSYLILTGGNDGGVKLIEIVSSNCSFGKNFEIFSKPDDFPRSVLFLNNETVLITMDSGYLYFVTIPDRQLKTPKIINNDKTIHRIDIRHYFAVAFNSTNLLAYGGLDGRIIIYNVEFSISDIELKPIYFEKVDSTKVMYLHWLKISSHYFLLVSLQDSKMLIINISTNYKHFLSLPYNKPDKNFWVNCCATSINYGKHLLLCGTRNGTLILYNLEELIKVENNSSELLPDCIIQKFHHKEGCANIFWNECTSQFISLGRSTPAELRCWNILTSEKNMELSSANYIRNPGGFTHITAISKHPYSINDLLLLGFRSDYFGVLESNAERLNFEETKLVFLKECGGSKRSWDFLSNESSSALVWINKRSVNFCCSPLLSLGRSLEFFTSQKVPNIYDFKFKLTNILSGIHGMDINTCVSKAISKGRSFCISGGEGCQMFSWIVETDTFYPILSEVHSLTRAHISNIRSIALSWPSNSFLVSAGGKGQFCIWSLVKNEQLNFLGYTRIRIDKLTDFRIMDLYVHDLGPESFIIYYVTSHGDFARMQVDLVGLSVKFHKSISLLDETSNQNVSCFLCVNSCTYLNSQTVNLVLGNSRGYLYWLNDDFKTNINNFIVSSIADLFNENMGQSALNDIDTFFDCNTDSILAFCGYDDGSVKLAQLSDRNINWKCSVTQHYASIVAVSLQGSLGITLGADHRLNLWQINNESVSFLRFLSVNGLGDPHCLAVDIEEEGNLRVFVCGVGIHMFRFSPNGDFLLRPLP